MINGKIISEKIIDSVAKKVCKQKKRPGLAVILVGNNQASQLYIKLKEKACLKAGIDFHKYVFEKNIKQDKILQTIEFLNKDTDINGILVQLPLPKKFDTDKIIQSITPQKDADGFSKVNIKNLYQNKPGIISGLCLGILELIKSANQPLESKKALIICNSKIFGQPLEKLLADKGVEAKTILGSDKNVIQQTKKADIIIIAVGKPNFLKADMVKKNAIIIDVGINKEKGKTVGDADFENILKKTEFITPVPGGVGPMCVAMLLHNVLECQRLQDK